MASTIVALDLLGLALAHQPVVDEHARQLVADGTMYEGRRDGGVDATRQAADDAGRADLLADQRDLLVDDVGHRPGRAATRDVVQKMLEHLSGRGRCA